ncbi:hypothetical protein [Aeromonas sp. 1HA1]|uniref:hypothetical protein n=1 Tax=Aeromonas sp. 1HA1 TaxID=2699193 RepID=UPI0023DE0350|nr:hypothetical protein [Aeromonas sp. 1HA1]MDF2414540.1 hypothetical protein [Aeromonas sp. 1HA1]
MKLVLLIGLGWLMGMPVHAAPPSVPRSELVADEGLQGHLDYLGSRLQQGQFAAMDSLLDSLAVGQREYLLCRLLTTLDASPSASSPELLLWVRAQSVKAPRWLVEKEMDGFLVQQPAYDFAAAARLVLSRWQQQVWQDNYRQLLEQNSFEFKQIYNSRNRDLALQQQALLAVLERQPRFVLQREARKLAAMSIFLPDNQLLRQLVERTGDTALYQKLWHQPVDHDSIAALMSVARFHQGQTASDLLIAASRNSRLTLPALQQLSQLSPLPDSAQKFLLAKLGKRQYSGQVASLLLQMDEPRLLAQLADRLTQQEKRHASPVMLPDTGTPVASPGL